jgi:hypothetical protein
MTCASESEVRMIGGGLITFHKQRNHGLRSEYRVRAHFRLDGPCMPDTGWLESIGQSLKTQTATWFVGCVIALLTVFSSKITESVKFAINRAALRPKYYEEIATDLSDFIFEAELNLEFVENGWTTADSLVPLIRSYNDAITKLRRNEYVYFSWLGRYWGDDKVAEFSTVVDNVKKFDQALHSLNDEFGEVNIKKSKPTVDAVKGKRAAEAMKTALRPLQQTAKDLLTRLR